MAMKPRYVDVIHTSSDINNVFLTAMDNLITKRTSELAFDKTIIAEIIELQDAESQRYLVKYQNSKFTAYGQKGATDIYRKGNNVYVKIPGGNFSSGLKRIEGRAYLSSAIKDNVESTDMTKAAIEIGYAYQNTEGTYSLLAGPESKKEENPYYESIVYDAEKEDSKESVNAGFIDYFKLYKNIQIKATVQTKFIGDLSVGNYGLKVDFYGSKKDEIITRTLDLRNFAGNLYNYADPTPQMAIYDMSVHNLTGIKKITLFQEKFINYDTMYDLDGETILAQNKTDPNIIFSKIQIAFINITDLTKNLYNLNIAAPHGLSLVQENDKVILEGHLFYSNQDITSKDTCECTWYKENPMVMQGSKLYDGNAGNGWEKIKDTSLIDFNKLTITYNDVYQMQSFKLIVQYNKSVTRTATVTVYRSYTNRFDVLETKEEEKKFLTLLDASTTKVKGCLWYIKLPDGTYIDVSNNEPTMKIDVSAYIIYPSIDVYCAIDLNNVNEIKPETPPRKPNEDEGRRPQPIDDPQNKEDEKDKDNSENKEEEIKVPKYAYFNYVMRSFVPNDKMKVYFEGTDTFLYNENGDISYTAAAQENTLIPNITWANQQVPTTDIRWYDSLGVEILAEPRPIVSSMIKTIYVEPTTGILHFTIRQKYADDANNNSITCKIITNNENFEFTKELIFLKQGEQGTNGSTYTLVVRPCDSEGRRLSDQQAFLYNEEEDPKNAWAKDFFVIAELYQDGNELNPNDSKYTLEYHWTGVNVTLNQENKSLPNVMKVSHNEKLNNDIEQGQYFVKCSIKIMKKVPVTEERSDQVLTYTYPILVGVNITNNINILSIPLSVMYNAAGNTPQYSKNKINFFYDNKKQNTPPKSLTPSTIEVEKHQILDDPPYYTILPVNTYDGADFYTKSDKEISGKMEDPMGAIRWNLDDNENAYIIQPIVMTLSTTNNESLKGWGGEQVQFIEPAKKKTAPEEGGENSSEPETLEERLATFLPQGLGLGEIGGENLNRLKSAISLGYKYSKKTSGGKRKRTRTELVGVDTNNYVAWELTADGEGTQFADGALKIVKNNKISLFNTRAAGEPEKQDLIISLDQSKIKVESDLPINSVENNMILSRKTLQDCLFTTGTPENKVLTSTFGASMKRYHYDLSAGQQKIVLTDNFSLGNAHLVFYNGILLDEPTHGQFYPNTVSPEAFTFTFMAETGDSLNIIVF